jgi:hypothetical protein
VINSYTVNAGCVPQEREESCNVQAKHGGPTSCYGWGPLAREWVPMKKRYGPFIHLQSHCSSPVTWDNAIPKETENLLAHIVTDEAIPETVEMSARRLALSFRLSPKSP